MGYYCKPRTDKITCECQQYCGYKKYLFHFHPLLKINLGGLFIEAGT
jgi:hypothetical protein